MSAKPNGMIPGFNLKVKGRFRNSYKNLTIRLDSPNRPALSADYGACDPANSWQVASLSATFSISKVSSENFSRSCAISAIEVWQ